MTMYSFLERYALAMLIMGLVALLLGLVVIPRISDNSVPSESEKVYEVPQRRGIEIGSDKHGAKVHLTGESASQHEEQLEKQRQIKEQLEKWERIAAIEAQMEQLASLANQDPAYALEMLDLEKEMLKLHQELGTLVIDKGDPFLSIEINRLVLSNMTSDKRVPVSVGEQLVDLLVEGGDIDGAATVYMVTQRALENGDEFFKLEHWTERGTSEQGGPEDSAVTTDPCCPDETTRGHLEDGHVHETPTIQPPTPAAAKSVEAELSVGLSPERFDKARQLIDEYGTKEGLRRLRESDPDAARQFERERGKPPVPSEPDDESSVQ